MDKLEKVREALELIINHTPARCNLERSEAKEALTALTEYTETPIERVEPRYNAVVVQLIKIHDSEEGAPQYAKMVHIECKDDEMLERLQEVRRDLLP